MSSVEGGYDASQNFSVHGFLSFVAENDANLSPTANAEPGSFVLLLSESNDSAW